MKFAHFNFNVLNLEKSLKFYYEALNLKIFKEEETDDFKILFLKDEFNSDFELELTYLKNRTAPYDLGEVEYHLAFKTKNYNEMYQKHKNMNVICFENNEMGIYFINDPDGYWIEIIPE